MKPSLALLLALVSSVSAALEVTEAPDPNISPTTGLVVTANVQGPPLNSTTVTLTLDDPNAGSFGLFNVSSTATYFFRATDTPPDPSSAFGIPSVEFYESSSPSGYQFGAVAGSDNWLYITGDGNTKAWAQLDLDGASGTATVLRYVHDPANPTADFTLAQAIEAASGPPPADRDIQIRSVDFTTGVIELKNYGTGTIDLSGWRFCTHNADQVLRYSGSTGLNGISIDAGASLFIHFNNDASGPNAINRSSTGGAWAAPLTNDAYAIGLYINGSFGVGANIADHLQWSRGGIDNTSADERSDEAQAGGVWTDQSTWIVTSAATEQIILTDTANGILHGPDDYLRLPDFGITGFQYVPADGDVTISFPAVNNLVVEVQKANDITTDDWSTVTSTSASSALLDNETDPEAYYRIVPQIP